MPQSGGNVERQKVPQSVIKLSMMDIEAKLEFRLKQKGSDTYASKHEIVGILEEEFLELKEELRIDTPEGYSNFGKELMDIAVGAIFGLACIKAGLVAPSKWEIEKEAKKDSTR